MKSSVSGILREEAVRLALAIQFLTRVPVPLPNIYTPERLTLAARYYPLVGIGVGVAGAVILTLALQIVLFPVAVILSVIGTILLTGAFHEDGFADTCDGIGGGQSKSQALEIMRDSRIGTYGALALVLSIGLKISLLALMPLQSAALTLIAAHGASRAAILLVLSTTDYARDEGSAKPLATGISAHSLFIGLAVGCVALIPLAMNVSGISIICGLLGLGFCALTLQVIVTRKIGGFTGDTLGAVQQVSELGFYLGVSACL